MANSHTQLYASQGNGGRATVTIGELGAIAVSPATTTTGGTVKQAATQANSTASDVAGIVADFNALLAKLRTAGIMAP